MNHFSSLVGLYLLTLSGQSGVTDDFRVQREIRSVWNGVRIKGEPHKTSTKPLTFSLLIKFDRMRPSLFQGEPGPRGLPGSTGSPVSFKALSPSKMKTVTLALAANPTARVFLLFRAQLEGREFQERLEIQDQWWAGFFSSLYISDLSCCKPQMLH